MASPHHPTRRTNSRVAREPIYDRPLLWIWCFVCAKCESALFLGWWVWATVEIVAETITLDFFTSKICLSKGTDVKIWRCLLDMYPRSSVCRACNNWCSIASTTRGELAMSKLHTKDAWEPCDLAEKASPEKTAKKSGNFEFFGGSFQGRALFDPCRRPTISQHHETPVIFLLQTALHTEAPLTSSTIQVERLSASKLLPNYSGKSGPVIFKTLYMIKSQL